MLTEEEKATLERERCEAKLRCRELWETILTLRRILRSYEERHFHWKKRFEKADRKLAENERLTKLPSPGERKKAKDLEIKLTKDQVFKIAEALGVELRPEDFEEQL